MSVKSVSILYHLLLSLGAFYTGGLMFLGGSAFDTWPQEWVGNYHSIAGEVLAYLEYLFLVSGISLLSFMGLLRRILRSF